MNKKPNAKEATIKICEAVWSCKDDKQKDGCYKMLENYIRDYGDDNMGVTFIQLELARLEKMIEKMKERQEQMQKAQDAHNANAKPGEEVRTKDNTVIDGIGDKGSLNPETQKIIQGEDGLAKIVPINTKVKK